MKRNWESNWKANGWKYGSLCLLLAALTLGAAGCGKETAGEPKTAGEAEETTGEAAAEEAEEAAGEAAAEEAEETAGEAAAKEADEEAEVTVLGEGETSFAFLVADAEGQETSFEIHTDKKTVGEALLDVGLIEGEDSEFGLFVKVVNGITADYDEDQTYWAFYINGEYAQSGVDATEIAEGDSYSFRVER